MLYPAKFGDLVRKQKELTRIQAQRENFATTLQLIAKNLLDQREMPVAITVDSVDKALLRLREELASVQKSREEILARLREQQKAVENQLFQELERKKSECEKQLTAGGINRQKLKTRLNDLASYSQVVNRELDRIRRLKSSGQLLADFKVTQCPVCAAR